MRDGQPTATFVTFSIRLVSTHMHKVVIQHAVERENDDGGPVRNVGHTSPGGGPKANGGMVDAR